MNSLFWTLFIMTASVICLNSLLWNVPVTFMNVLLFTYLFYTFIVVISYLTTRVFSHIVTWSSFEFKMNMVTNWRGLPTKLVLLLHMPWNCVWKVNQWGLSWSRRQCVSQIFTINKTFSRGSGRELFSTHQSVAFGTVQVYICDRF